MSASKRIYASSLMLSAIFMVVRAPDATGSVPTTHPTTLKTGNTATVGASPTTGNAPTGNGTKSSTGNTATTASIATNVTVPRPVCVQTDEWLSFNNSDYRRLKLDPPKRWSDANFWCGMMDGHLATIRTKAENDFIRASMLPDAETNKECRSYEMWIGLYLQWATCDDCNNVQSARWIDDTPLEESELLPKPITLLAEKSGKYPWESAKSAQKHCTDGGACNQTQPHQAGSAEGFTSYFVSKDDNAGDWRVHLYEDVMEWALCQKKSASK